MEFDPELLKLLLKLLAHSPWFILAIMIVWPEKGVLALWIKRGRDIKLAEIERDKVKARVQERAMKRLRREPDLLSPPKGDSDDNAR